MAEVKCAQFESELNNMFIGGGASKCEIVGKCLIASYYTGQLMRFCIWLQK
jgi:hypothetical protein